MGERRKSREFVLQMLYSMDISKLSCDETLRLFWFSNPGESAEVRKGLSAVLWKKELI